MRNKRKFAYGLLVALLLVAGVFSEMIINGKNAPLRVVFLDVGQGDSILISEGSEQILIDGGKDGKLLLEKLGRHVPFWDRKIEIIIETHPDADHIGGLIDVVRTYEVDSILKTKMQSESQTFKKLEETIQAKNVENIEAKKDVTLKFASGATVQVLYPFETVVDINGKDTNMQSVVVKLSFGENDFLLTGDMPSEQEKELLAKSIDVSAEYLKVGHHGSKYSTTSEFLDAVKPMDAIISVGKNNSYGHPSSETMQRLLQHKTNILRTDESGDIIYECQNSDSKCILKSLQ